MTQLRVAGSEKLKEIQIFECLLLKIPLRNHSTCLVPIQASLYLAHRWELEAQEKAHDHHGHTI